MKNFLSLLFLGSSALGHTLMLYATHYSGTVNKLEFDPDTRHLIITQSLKACGKLPSWLTLDQDTNTLYCLDESGDVSSGTPGSLTAFHVAPNGDLAENATVNTMPGGVHSTVYGKEKKYLAIANYGSSAIQTFALPFHDGSKPLQNITFGEGSKPHAVYVDPLTQSSLIVPDLGSDTIRVYGISGNNTGLLTKCPQLERVWEGRGPRHAAFTRDNLNNTMMYVANENSNTILTFRLHHNGTTTSGPSDTGNKYTRSSIIRRNTIGTITHNLLCPSLEFVSEFENILGTTPVPKEGAYLGEIRAAENNRDLYVSLRGDKSFGGHDSIIQLQAATANNTLNTVKRTLQSTSSTSPISYIRHSDSFGQFPRSFEISPDGTYVAIGNQASSNVAIVKRDPVYGHLGELVAWVPVGEPGDPKQGGGLSSVIWGKN